MYEFIINEFYQEMSGVNLNVYGLLDSNDTLHTLGTDSKIIGRVFEILTQPILEKIAKCHNLILKTPESQTVYPDFILMPSEESKEKVAIDIKTTYISDDKPQIKFTLGSYGSYMRNNTKNIEYCYSDYCKHFVICFVYKRKDEAQSSKCFELKNRKEITCPYYDVKFFIQEKYKISGETPGSGNTENIGSFETTVFDHLKEGNGPFSFFENGEHLFNCYWKSYKTYRNDDKTFTSLPEYFTWLKQNTGEADDAQINKYIQEYNKWRYTYSPSPADLLRKAEKRIVERGKRGGYKCLVIVIAGERQYLSKTAQKVASFVKQMVAENLDFDELTVSGKSAIR